MDIENLSSDNPLSDDEDYGCDVFEDEDDINAASTSDNAINICHNNLEIINDVTQRSSLLDKNERECFISELRHWAIKYKICLSAINDLFRILRKYISPGKKVYI